MRVACDDADLWRTPHGSGPHPPPSRHAREDLPPPLSGNVEWRQVLSLLEAVGTTTQEPNGKVKVELGGETQVFHPPDGKDVDRQLIVDLRRMLTNAGLAPS
jgi:hypothetical protein